MKRDKAGQLDEDIGPEDEDQDTGIEIVETDDPFSSAVAAIAVPTAQSKFKRKYKSRFFFTLRPALEMEVKRRAAALAPKVLEHVDKHIVDRVKAYKKQLPPELAANVDAIREFFLREISPLTLAMRTGADQATEVIQNSIGSKVDDGVRLQFERMIAKGINIKLARYVETYLGLPKGSDKILLEAISPVKKEAVFLNAPFPAQPAGPRRHERRWKPEGEE